MFSKLLVAICAVLLALTNAKFGNKLVTRKLASKSDLQQVVTKKKIQIEQLKSKFSTGNNNLRAEARKLSDHAWEMKVFDLGWSYENGDPALEYHCYDTLNTKKTYVRGTYGDYGYFEGGITNGVHDKYHLSFYETDPERPLHLSITGAGVLTQGSSDEFPSGNFWNTGDSKVYDSLSVNEWGLQADVTSMLDDFTEEEREWLPLMYCYYDAAKVANLKEGMKMSNLNDIKFGGIGSFLSSGLDYSSNWLGAYSTDGELGVLERIHTMVNNNGRLFVGAWRATNLPECEGKPDCTGAAIYFVVQDKNDVYHSIGGWFDPKGLNFYSEMEHGRMKTTNQIKKLFSHFGGKISRQFNTFINRIGYRMKK